MDKSPAYAKLDKTPAYEKARALPALGDVVMYRAADAVFPMIVTNVGKASFSGQAFLAGTEVRYVENATIGDDVGQCAAK